MKLLRFNGAILHDPAIKARVENDEQMGEHQR
jgi:hypothetical protein